MTLPRNTLILPVLLACSLAALAGCERVEADPDLLRPFPGGVHASAPGASAAAQGALAATLPKAAEGADAPEPATDEEPVAEPAVGAVVPLGPGDEGPTPDASPIAAVPFVEASPVEAPPVAPETSGQQPASAATSTIGGAPVAVAAPAPRWASSVPASAALAAWPLHQIALVATVPGGPSPLAVIRLPDGAEHVVRVGTVVGDTGARVTWIGADQIALAEIVLDASGRPSLGQRVLRAAESPSVR